jgi:23S rRNA pseudouridine1911/1915/1917 synthase
VKKSLTVLAREEGATLASFLSARGVDVKAIARGSVHVSGKRVSDPKRKLYAGEKVLVYEGTSAKANANEDADANADVDEHADAPAPQIIHEDNDLIVVDKPPGVPVQPTRQAAANSLEARLKARALHRLDLEASGLVALAKRDIDLKIQDLARVYLALASGRVKADQGRWTSPVAGKPAATRFRVIDRFANATLLECELETGRTHQIRVHAAAAHHPLIGDTRHGGPAAPRLALHAIRLGNWQSPPPPDFEALVNAARAA